MKRIILSLSLVSIMITGMAMQPSMEKFSILTKICKARKDERTVKDFNGVAAGGPIHVIITLGNTESLKFEGDADAIATLISEVKGNVLIIRPQTSWTSWARKYQNKKIVAYVSAKTIKSLTMSGDGSITVKGNINGASLATTLSGSGQITASADVEDFVGVISGSGNINITGSADQATVTISGSGNVAKKGFTVDNLKAVISGSGSVNVNANKHINAVISGSGNINYSGNATVEKRTFGSGSVRKV